MKDIVATIHKEIDKAFAEPYLLMQQYGIRDFGPEEKYYAADVITSAYKGKFLKGLACACQSFMNARLLHDDMTAMTPVKVLLGDYFAGLAGGFELPENSFEILNRFAGFIEEDMAYLADDSGKRRDLKRFEKLFLEVAEVANE